MELQHVKTILYASSLFAQQSASKTVSSHLHDLGAVNDIVIFFKDTKILKDKQGNKMFRVQYDAFPQISIPLTYLTEHQKSVFLNLHSAEFNR